VCIAKANIYAEKGYDVLAHGNSRRTTITPGISALVLAVYLGYLGLKISEIPVAVW